LPSSCSTPLQDTVEDWEHLVNPNFPIVNMKTSALLSGLLALGASANPLTPEKAVADIKTQE
jgi:hypothetical protein